VIRSFNWPATSVAKTQPAGDTRVHDTIVWISGATDGLGLGLARNVPYPEARIINLSRRRHPDYESVQFDLTEPSTWEVVRAHFVKELHSFKGKRVIFIHNAYMGGTQGYVGEVDPGPYQKAITANVVAPLVLGDAFVRACKPGYESGLVLITSAAARVPWEGDSIYCAAKAAAEHWVRVVRRERNRRDSGPWVVAVRPGFVDTPAVRAAIANPDADRWPLGPFVKRDFEAGKAFDIETAGRNIWGALPPDPGKSVLLFGEMVVEG
jgi:NAD(P)-dependent dehydrogenase (short-subunit alcohol dehydrogenase family)